MGEMALTIEQCECIPADSAPVLVVSGAIALGTDTLDGVLTVAVRHLQASGSRSLGEDCPLGGKDQGRGLAPCRYPRIFPRSIFPHR